MLAEQCSRTVANACVPGDAPAFKCRGVSISVVGAESPVEGEAGRPRLGLAGLGGTEAPAWGSFSREVRTQEPRPAQIPFSVTLTAASGLCRWGRGGLELCVHLVQVAELA